MRQVVRVLAVSGVVAILPRAYAQSDPPPLHDPVIQWDSSRPLTLNDFKGQLPPSLRFGSRSWIKIETTWGCAGKTFMPVAVATFDPMQSWWRGSQWDAWQDVDTRKEWLERSRADAELKRNTRYSNADLLRHEQTHFDLAELAAGRIRQRLSELADVCTNPDRDTLITDIVRGINADFRTEQTRYDEDTVHGTNLAKQRVWNERTARALGERSSASRATASAFPR